MERESKTHPLAIILTSSEHSLLCQIIRHIVLFDISLKTGYTIDLYLSADMAPKLSADMTPKLIADMTPKLSADMAPN